MYPGPPLTRRHLALRIWLLHDFHRKTIARLGSAPYFAATKRRNERSAPWFAHAARSAPCAQTARSAGLDRAATGRSWFLAWRALSGTWPETRLSRATSQGHLVRGIKTNA